MYGIFPAPRTLAAGTYWIPMAQAPKHWIQSMLNEDTYVPHDVTDDVTGWSNPLSMNVPEASRVVLEPVEQPVVPLEEPDWPSDAPADVSVALFEGPGRMAEFGGEPSGGLSADLDFELMTGRAHSRPARSLTTMYS